MEKKNVKMEMVNLQAAGIDVGSRSHFVAIGQGDDDIREYGVYNEDLRSLTEWLLNRQIRTVAI